MSNLWTRQVLAPVWRPEPPGVWPPAPAGDPNHLPGARHSQVAVLVPFIITGNWYWQYWHIVYKHFIVSSFVFSGHFSIRQLLHVVQADAWLFDPEQDLQGRKAVDRKVLILFPKLDLGSQILFVSPVSVLEVFLGFSSEWALSFIF